MLIWPGISLVLAAATTFLLANRHRDPIRIKIGQANRRISKSVRSAGYPNTIHWYGAYHIDPKYLVIWVCVKTDKEKIALSSDAGLLMRLRMVLDDVEYPKAARKSVHIGFESSETVNRESEGNWYQHFK